MCECAKVNQIIEIKIVEFEDVNDAPKYARCIACTIYVGQETLVQKSGRNAHLNSQKHRDAVLANERTQAEELARNLHPMEAATLTLPNHFLGADIGASEHTSPVFKLFDNYEFNGDQLFDLNGEEVFLSAGKDNNLNDVALRVELKRGLDSLDHGIHTVFGKRSTTLDESDTEESGENLTVGDIVMEMQAMGKNYVSFPAES